MKVRNFILFALAVATATVMHAQSFYKGCSVVTAGYGAPNLATITFRVIYNISEHTNYTFSAMGPVTLRYEYGIADRLGIGLGGGFTTASVGYNFEDWNSTHTQKVPYTAKITWKSPSAGVRLNYHFINRDKVDPYIGLGLGYTNNTFTYSDDSPLPDDYKTPGLGSVYFSAGLGFRCYFTPNIGVYAELGWDKFALAQAGLAAKF